MAWLVCRIYWSLLQAAEVFLPSLWMGSQRFYNGRRKSCPAKVWLINLTITLLLLRNDTDIMTSSFKAFMNTRSSKNFVLNIWNSNGVPIGEFQFVSLSETRYNFRWRAEPEIEDLTYGLNGHLQAEQHKDLPRNAQVRTEKNGTGPLNSGLRWDQFSLKVTSSMSSSTVELCRLW